MNFAEKTTLGKTGLEVGRLGISSSFGAPCQAFEEAFDKGCNYFSWGTFIKGRSSKMKQAVKNIIGQGKRDQLVLSVWSYSHSSLLMEPLLERGLKALGSEYADVLVLGYYSRCPPRRILDQAQKLKQKGKIRFIGLSSHNRKLFPKLAADGLIDIFHVRYNAAHRGAESEVFSQLDDENRPGIVSFTATRWGKLLNPKKMPPGESALSSTDCYRFALSHPSVDVCMTGTKNLEQMQQALKTLEAGPLADEEMARIRKIGDHVYGKKR
jgi:predicted aldo/keto reductase-like oxidoreductase